MGKRTYKIWNEATKETADSIIARPGSKEKKAFIDKFHDEYQEISHYHFPNNEFRVYELLEECDDGCSYHISYNNLRKADIEKLKWEKVHPDLANVFFRQLLEVPYYTINGCVYASKEAIETVKKVLKTEYKPLVIKNTDFPYWFDVEGRLLPSEEPNWFLFLYQNFNVVSRDSLENYKGKSSTKKAKE